MDCCTIKAGSKILATPMETEKKSPQIVEEFEDNNKDIKDIQPNKWNKKDSPDSKVIRSSSQV